MEYFYHGPTTQSDKDPLKQIADGIWGDSRNAI